MIETITLSVAPPDRELLKKQPSFEMQAAVVQRALYQTALEKCKGNITLAARMCGVDRRSIQRVVAWHWHPSGKRMNGHSSRSEYGSRKKDRPLSELGSNAERAGQEDHAEPGDERSHHRCVD